MIKVHKHKKFMLIAVILISLNLQIIIQFMSANEFFMSLTIFISFELSIALNENFFVGIPYH